MKALATPYSLLQAIKQLDAMIKRLESISINAGAHVILAGTAAPNGMVTATGPAIYLQTSASGTTVWYKNTSGTSNSEWGA